MLVPKGILLAYGFEQDTLQTRAQARREAQGRAADRDRNFRYGGNVVLGLLRFSAG